MITSRPEPQDTARKSEEYEDRTRSWVFVCLVLFPLAIILVVAFTSPEPVDTTNQMGNFLGGLHSSENEPIAPDMITDDESSKTLDAAAKSSKQHSHSKSPSPKSVTPHDGIERTGGSFEAWASWMRLGFQRATKRWLD